MKIKKLVLTGAVVVALGAMLFAGCAKPPTEKVAALQADFTTVTEQGAQVFAQAEFDQVNTQMAELQNLMDSKKFKEAGALADSIAMALETLKAAIETNGQQMSQTEVSSANEEIAKLKILCADNAKVLGADAQKYTEQMAALESQGAGLQAEIDNKNFLNAFNTAQSIKDQVAASTQEIIARAEAAKPAKGKKK